MAESLRYGVYGVGRIGRIHAQIIRQQGNIITAIGDDVPECAAEAAKHLDLSDATVFTSAAEMAKHSNIDAVIIASATKDHIDHGKAFLLEGIPIYMEKPLADNLDAAKELAVDIRKNQKLSLQVGLQRRFDPALKHSKKVVASGVIGDVREIRCVVRDQRDPPDGYECRSIIIDMGIHLTDEAIWLLGEHPTSVWARSFKARTTKETPNTAFVHFTTETGIVGRLEMSRTHSSGYNNETYIIGTEGTIHVGRFDGYPGPVHVDVWLSDKKAQNHELSQSFPMADCGQPCAEFLPRFQHAYVAAHHSFQQVVRRTTNKLATGVKISEENKDNGFECTYSDALSAQAFAEAAHISAAADGRLVELRTNAKGILELV